MVRTSGAASRALLVLALVLARPRSLLAGPPRTGQFAVEVNVEGAEISVDGVLVARSPMSGPMRLRSGDHSLKVSKPGHAEFLDVVKVLPDETTRIEVELIAFAAHVEITTRPPGALVLIDGKAIGQTPFQGEVEPGPREVKVRLDGYLDGKRTEQLVAGESYRIDLLLAPVPRAAAGRRGKPLYRRWWVWTAAGAIVTGTIVTTAIVAGGDDPFAGVDRIVEPTW